jgi:hypothetical protein
MESNPSELVVILTETEAEQNDEEDHQLVHDENLVHAKHSDFSSPG